MANLLALIIEDDPQLSVLYQETIRASGYTPVERITDGAAAIERLKEVVPALIILDDCQWADDLTWAIGLAREWKDGT